MPDVDYLVVAGGAGGASGGGGTCPSTPSENQTTASTHSRAVGYDNNDFQAGQSRWQNASAREICMVQGSFIAVGTISAIEYRVYIYETTATCELGALVATSDAVLGTNSWSGTVVRFPFSTSYTTTPGQLYNFVVRRSDGLTSTVNFVGLEFAAAGGTLTGVEDSWNNAGTAILCGDPVVLAGRDSTMGIFWKGP